MTAISANAATASRQFTGTFATLAKAIAWAFSTYRTHRDLSRDVAQMRKFDPHMLSDIGLPGFATMSPTSQEEYFAHVIRNAGQFR